MHFYQTPHNSFHPPFVLFPHIWPIPRTRARSTSESIIHPSGLKRSIVNTLWLSPAVTRTFHFFFSLDELSPGFEAAVCCWIWGNVNSESLWEAWRKSLSWWESSHNKQLTTRTEGVQQRPFLNFLSVSIISGPRHLTLQSQSFSVLHPPSTHPFSIVCPLIFLSLPWYPALHKEEAALPLPSSLVRTIRAWSLTPVSLSVCLSFNPRRHEAGRLLGFMTKGLVLENRGGIFLFSVINTSMNLRHTIYNTNSQKSTI